MKKFGIIFGCFVMFGCMLTATFVFADVKEEPVKKSYYVEKEEINPAVEKDLVLSEKLEKTVSTPYSSFDYSIDVVDGNVILTNLDTNIKDTVYSNGDAKYITEVNFYYYDSSYLLLITNDGSLYANIYSSNENKIKFRHIATNNKIDGMKVVEKKQRFYEYPVVELFGVNENSDWELIKL